MDISDYFPGQGGIRLGRVLSAKVQSPRWHRVFPSAWTEPLTQDAGGEEWEYSQAGSDTVGRERVSR